MLGKLFGSQARVKILKKFLHNPGEKFYIRQLARELGLQLNSIRRELENLEQFGLLASFVSSDDNNEEGEKTAKKTKSQAQEKKYYQANKDFVLFNEIKELIVKAQVLHEKDCVDKLKLVGNIKLLVLTGIFSGNENSPIDLLIVGKFNKNKLARLVKNLEDELGKEINYTAMDTKEFIFRRDLTDMFLYGVLESKNIVVVDELGVCS